MKLKVNKSVYLLILLIEECAEVIHQACKAIRFGMEEVQPNQEFNNKERLNDELSDLIAVKNLCQHAGLLPLPEWKQVEQIKAKQLKIAKYMRYSEKECGTILDD